MNKLLKKAPASTSTPDRHRALPLSLPVCVILLLMMTLHASADYAFGPTVLSSAESVCDLDSRAAISDSGDWLGSVWIQGDKSDDDCSSDGQAALSWATESSVLDEWQPPKTLPLPQDACAMHADLAIDGSTAYVAVNYRSPCDSQLPDSGIRIYVCNLADGTCTSQGDALVVAGTTFRRVFDVRVALDDADRLHVVYVEGTHSLVNSTINYTYMTGSGWSEPQLLSTGDTADGTYQPAVAYANGRLHVVWERRDNYLDDYQRSRKRGDVQYRYCDITTGDCPDDALQTYPYPSFELLPNATYPVPSIDARDNQVVIAWNWCADLNNNPPCNSFYVLYAHSSDSGTTMSDSAEVVTNLPGSAINYSLRRIDGSDDWSDLPYYAETTRPSVAIDDDGLPTIAWQVLVDMDPSPDNVEVGYVISTTHAVDTVGGSFLWDAEAGRQLGSGETRLLAPAVLSVDSARDPEGLHIIYTSEWSQLVGQSNKTRSQVSYDYLGQRRPSLAVTADAASHPLPEERRLVIQAEVKDGFGNPAPGVLVGFETDFGGFENGTTVDRIVTATTNSLGQAEATLVTNLPGSANVTVWLDTDRDGQLDSGETFQATTRTWVVVSAPSILVSNTSIRPGDLMTATLMRHPYFDQTSGGSMAAAAYAEVDSEATEYALWWCAASGTGDLTQQIAGPLTMDAASWSNENIPVDVPATADGTYYLESRIDGEASPCAAAGRIATSADIQVSDTPTAGQPWLSVSPTHPDGSVPLAVTVGDHQPGAYELWWCPAASGPAGAKVADVAVASGSNPSVSFSLPGGSAEYYRVESHTADLVSGDACGQASSLQAQSSLIQPSRRVFLPLVLKAPSR